MALAIWRTCFGERSNDSDGSGERIHGADGLREFARPKAITRRRMRSPLPSLSFDRSPKQVRQIARAIKLIHARSRG